MTTHILISWFKTFDSKQKTQKDEKLVSEKKLYKMLTYINRIKQNNDYAKIMRKIQFRSSVNLYLLLFFRFFHSSLYLFSQCLSYFAINCILV